MVSAFISPGMCQGRLQRASFGETCVAITPSDGLGLHRASDSLPSEAEHPSHVWELSYQSPS